MRIALMVTTLAAASVLALPARAYEDKATLELGVGYAAIPGDATAPQNGVQAALLSSWGFKGPWSLRGQLSYSLHPDNQPLHVAMATAEVLYSLDIVRFVPFAGLGVDGVLSARNGRTEGDFGLHAVLGVDFLINPKWLIGLDVRGTWLPAELSSDLQPFYLAVVLRAGLVFDLL